MGCYYIIVGLQLVKSIDSMVANIAERTGRGTYQNNKKAVRMGRVSLNETQHWLRRAYKIELLKPAQGERLKIIIDA